jgi:hypothetical protein
MLWLSAASVGKWVQVLFRRFGMLAYGEDSGHEKVEEDTNHSQTKMRGRMLIALAMEISTERLFIG